MRKKRFIRVLIMDNEDGFLINIKPLKNKNEITQIGIYNINGYKVRVLWEKAKHEQKSEFFWDKRNEQGKRVEKGIYFIGVRLKGKLNIDFENILFVDV